MARQERLARDMLYVAVFLLMSVGVGHVAVPQEKQVHDSEKKDGEFISYHLNELRFIRIDQKSRAINTPVSVNCGIAFVYNPNFNQLD